MGCVMLSLEVGWGLVSSIVGWHTGIFGLLGILLKIVLLEEQELSGVIDLDFCRS